MSLAGPARKPTILVPTRIPAFLRSLGLVSLLCAAGLLGARAAAAQDISMAEYREAVKALSEAQVTADAGAFLEAFRTVLRMGDPRALRTAVTAYERFAPTAVEKLSPRDFLWLHGKAAASLGAVTSEECVEEFRRLQAKSRQWATRLLLLDASGFVRQISLLDSCIAALDDPSPIVIRRSLRYLRKARRPAVVDLIIERYLELSRRKGGADTPEWERTLLTFQSALHELLKVDLPTAEDYRNYFAARRDSPDLFDPKEARGSETTRVTLFGAPVTGKNMAFVLDTSGSMLSTDPRPRGEPDPDRGKTVVGDPSRQPGGLAPPLDRQRMFRAKKELSSVVRALPYDVQFNIITFDTFVRAWQKSTVAASDGNKKGAVEFIEAQKADGITFTDQALEQAFSDLEIDTIYLITDGAPTHVGTTGPPGPKPPDSDAIIAQIHERVEELNFLRGVRIFTLGFRGAEEDFLKKLAADHSGTYFQIR